MGSLHDGHFSLVDRARAEADVVVVSIFVNPSQFGPDEDLETYPRDLKGDLAALERLGVDVVFAPSTAEMYPAGFVTHVDVDHLTTGLCGESRPTHFRGVTTVVTLLLNVVRPHVAVFGQKDYQQLAVIRRMVRDLGLGVSIVGEQTVRESDGLALSSRNLNLTPTQRAAAPSIHRALRAVRDAFEEGERSRRALSTLAEAIIEGSGTLRIEYLDFIDPDELCSLPSNESDTLPERLHMAVAVFAGSTRLIDNTRIAG